MAEAYGEDGSGAAADVGRRQVAFSRTGFPSGVGDSPEIEQVQDGDNGNTTDVIDIIVYFMDNSGVHVKVKDGQNIDAGELFEVVKDVMHLPDVARDAFSLWLVSDLLELQLKPNHVPFKLVCYWEELLEKYTSAPEERVQRDEPVIMFRRNVFFPRESEKALNEVVLLRYLYHEAKKHIMVGRYPLCRGDCDSQAAVQALITREEEEGSLDDSTFGTAAYFKSRLTEYLPPHFWKRNWIYKTGENPERRLEAAYNDASNKCRSFSLDQLYRRYLDFCRSQAYYGSAFFRGQAEHPSKGIVNKYLSNKDDPVYVAINMDGVFVIDLDDVALLIGLYYENLSWQYVESSQNVDNANSNCLPCLFLQFPSEEHTNETKLLQIFSREAVLMDNLIEACVMLKRTTGPTKNKSECKTLHGKGELADTFNRLALMTLDANGKCIRSTIRCPKQKPSQAGTTV